MDCTSTPTVVCELARIADSLADKSPSPFEWAQFIVTLVSAIGTLAVGALAAYIAFRSHRLAEATQLESAVMREDAARRAFHDEIIAAIDAVAEAAISGDDQERYRARTRVQNLMMYARTPDSTEGKLATAVREFADRLTAMGDAGKLSEGGRGEVAAIKTRTVIWLIDPDLSDRAPAGYWEEMAKRLPEAAETTPPAPTPPPD